MATSLYSMRITDVTYKRQIRDCLMGSISKQRQTLGKFSKDRKRVVLGKNWVYIGRPMWPASDVGPVLAHYGILTGLVGSRCVGGVLIKDIPIRWWAWRTSGWSSPPRRWRGTLCWRPPYPADWGARHGEPRYGETFLGFLHESCLRVCRRRQLGWPSCKGQSGVSTAPCHSP